MGFEPGRRGSRCWDDAKKLDEMIREFPFHTTGKSEREFETGFATNLISRRRDFHSKPITQIDKSTTVNSVRCFGKRHRPDMTLDTDGVAIELKFITYAGLKDAIGQGYLYRIQYRFVFIVLIVSEDRKDIYEDLAAGKEKDLEDTLRHLADRMNIFSYVVPAFVPKPGIKKCFSFFEDPDASSEEVIEGSSGRAVVTPPLNPTSC